MWFVLLSFSPFFCLSHDNQSSVTFMLIDICCFDVNQVEAKSNPKREASLQWDNCEDQIDLAALSLKEHILFYDEVGPADRYKYKTHSSGPFDVLILYSFR